MPKPNAPLGAQDVLLKHVETFHGGQRIRAVRVVTVARERWALEAALADGTATRIPLTNPRLDCAAVMALLNVRY